MARILIVDDNKQIAETTRLLLVQMRHVAQSLTNPMQFMKTFVLFRPDVVILDMLMPDIDGMEILQWLMDVNYTGRVVLMSGDPTYLGLGIHLAEARGRMSIRTLHKPFEADELERALSDSPWPRRAAIASAPAC